MKEVKCATKAFIMDDGKILVIKQKSGEREVWDMPGGKIDFGLTPEENLKKEVLEEVGIDVRIKKLMGVSQFISRNGDQIVCINYLCEPMSKNLDLSRNPDTDENITEAFWLSPQDFFTQLPEDKNSSLKSFVKNYFLEKRQ